MRGRFSPCAEWVARAHSLEVPPNAWGGGRLFARTVAFLVVYFALVVAAYPSGFLASPGVPLWWPAGGFALGVFVRTPRRAIPFFLAPLFVLLLAMGIVGVPAGRHMPPLVSLGYAASAVTVPLFGAGLIKRFGSRPFDLSRVRDVLVFAVCGAFLPSLLRIAWVYVTWLVWPEPRPVFRVLTSWNREAYGVLTVAPILIQGLGRGLPRERRGEAAVLVALFAAATWGAFGFPTLGARVLSLALAAFPLLSWAAARFGSRGAAAATCALSAVSTVLTVHGLEPVWTDFRGADAQALLSMAALSALVLAAFGEERGRLLETVRAEARRLEEAFALLDGLLRSAPIGVAIYDRQLRFVRINEALARINGHPPQDHIGRRIEEMVPGIGKMIGAELQGVLDRGVGVVGREVAGVLPSEPGKVRSFLCNWFPIAVKGDAPAGVGAIVLEITERVEAEAARKRVVAELEEALRVRDDFLSVASHELKTPLTPLAARLQALQRAANSGLPIDARAIEKARDSLARLTALIRDLLDVSQIRDARLAVRMEPVSLSKVLEEVVEPYRHGARHQLELDLPPTEVLVLGERARLAQVVDNLVDNAIKYSPGGGRIAVSLDVEHGDAHLEVADQGIGIPPGDRALVFDRYYRAANSSVRSYGGLGLGLYLCRAIVERHGGRIWLESEIGRGSTFHVTLPRIEVDGVPVSVLDVDARVEPRRPAGEREPVGEGR